MKKVIVCFSVLAVIVIAAVVFSFCTKQTETVNYHSAQGVKVRKGGLVPCDYSQRYTSHSISLPSRPDLCIIVEIVCCNCLIDGWFDLINCETGEKLISRGTFHVVKQGNNWVWGYIPSFPLPSGVSYNDLLGILTDSWFTPCCGTGTGTGGPCGPIRPVIKLPSGKCVTVDITCCNGEINGSFEEVDCNTGNPIKTGLFCAKYQGDPNNPNEFNDPNKWSWCGDLNHPSDILEVLKNTWLVPCFQ
jgi:hypothetical protein